MIPRSFSLLCRRQALSCATLLLVLAAALPLQAAGPETLDRAETAQTIDGEGDRAYLIEGPFTLTWRTPGGSFAVKVTDAASGKTAAASSTTGQGNGRVGVREEKRYRVAITASGPWRVTVTW